MTPYQRREREISARRVEAMAIDAEVNAATDEQLETVVAMTPQGIARAMGIHVVTAIRLRRAATQRITERQYARRAI